MAAQFETDVLIVGSGPSGSATAALLSTYGIRNAMVSKYGWLAETPRAHITNQRTMEVLRDLGLEARADAASSKQNLMANNVFCHSLAGEEFGRILSWGNHPLRKADYELASPCAICDIPQDLLEPILFEAAAKRGTAVRLNTEFLDLAQDEAGVTARVRDRVSGEEYDIRAKYLVGADGARSRVAETLGLPMEGRLGLSGSMNIIFTADLTKYVAHRPSVLYWILQPGAEIGGIGAGVVRMVRPWTEWLAIWGTDGSPEKVSHEDAERIVRQMIGDDEIPIAIRSTSLWTVNNMYAGEYSRGRVFCMGDAVHRHPPLNGLGSNTSIQDAWNLAWKLAMVLRGEAGAGLLASYSAERQPVGRQIVARANRSIEDYPPIFEAVGLLASKDADEANAAIAARKAPTAEGKERRRRLVAAIDRKNYEFNTHGVELGQRYASSAVAPDGTPEPAYTRDPELYYHATTWPGAHLPHAWVERDGRRVSTLDLCGKGRFTLLTGIGGEGWVAAARGIAGRAGLGLDGLTVGPDGCDALDIYADWMKLREVEDDGCVLVRPDGFVAWRAATLAPDPEAALAGVLSRILDRADIATAPERAAVPAH